MNSKFGGSEKDRQTTKLSNLPNFPAIHHCSSNVLNEYTQHCFRGSRLLKKTSLCRVCVWKQFSFTVVQNIARQLSKSGKWALYIHLAWTATGHLLHISSCFKFCHLLSRINTTLCTGMICSTHYTIDPSYSSLTHCKSLGYHTRWARMYTLTISGLEYILMIYERKSTEQVCDSWF